MPPTLAIIGCGKVGRTLGRLWHESGAAVVQDVLNRSAPSARQAAAFIGAGRPLTDYRALRLTDVVMIAAPDDEIAACSAALAENGFLTADSIVFHCSGALPSAVLRDVQASGAAIASVHPVRSFANPEKVVAEFAGTYCGVEGDARAITALNRLFAAVGGRFVPIEPERKILYHAGAVFASNYLVTLLDTAVQTYARAGIPQDVALKMMALLVRETAENVLQLGPEKALTGPIARGDVATVVRQYQTVKASSPTYGKLYREMGKLTARLARRRAPS